MPPTFLASWGWERPSARRRSLTLSPTDLARSPKDLPTVFMGVVYKKNWWLHKIPCNLRVQQGCLLTLCKRSCLVPVMGLTGTTEMPEKAKEKPKEIGALRQAIRHHLKSQVAVARAVGVSPQAVSEILRRGKRVPAEWCLAIETA